MAGNFWAWFDGVRAKAAEQPVGKIVKSDGWDVGHLGGGCLGWEKLLSEHKDLQALITVDEEAPDDLFAPDYVDYDFMSALGVGLKSPHDAPYIAGIHDEDGTFIGRDCWGVLAAMAFLNAALSLPDTLGQEKDTEALLCAELNEYARLAGLEPASADEMLLADGLADHHKRYLRSFIERWDAVMNPGKDA